MKTMKTNILSLTLISLIGLMGACTTSNQENTGGLKTIHVEVDNIRTDVKLSEFAEAQIIPLPTSDDLLIGKIKKVCASDKSICISAENTIYRFTRSGEYLGKISKHGEGPDEYTGIRDFIITEDDEVAIFTLGKQALMFYSWDNQLKKKIKLDVSPSARITRMEDKLVINNGNKISNTNKYVLMFIDLNSGEMTNELLPVDEYKAKYLYSIESNTFTPGENDTTCYFYTGFNDTIYRITPNTCQPEVAFDWDGKNIPNDYYRHDYPSVVQFLDGLTEGQTFGTHFQLKSDNYLMVQYEQRRKGHQTVVIPSNGGAPINMKEAHIDELGGFPLDMTCNAYYDNKFPTGYNEAFFVVQPMDILDYVEEHAPESLDEVKKKIKHTSDDQNPVLLVINLK